MTTDSGAGTVIEWGRFAGMPMAADRLGERLDVVGLRERIGVGRAAEPTGPTAPGLPGFRRGCRRLLASEGVRLTS